MINYVGVDYSVDLPVHAIELSPRKATDSEGSDVKALLNREDDHYHVMESTDQPIHVAFDVPQKPAEMNRSFILKATGYYDIHVEADGEPEEQLLSRIDQEPGFAARYAADQIARWHEEALTTLASR
jgi:hypothetical protein